jgi:hypothetical protein
VEYLYSAGVRPEIGLCVEYLSWNKEQRMYMGWLRDFYAHLFFDGQSKKSQSELLDSSS